jgi:hypothetical protein
VKVKGVSSWLCLLRNYITMMHGQQNIKNYQLFHAGSLTHEMQPPALIIRVVLWASKIACGGSREAKISGSPPANLKPVGNFGEQSLYQLSY